MAKTTDLPAGTRFGRWTILERSGSNKHGMTLVHAVCDCGREFDVIAANLKAGLSKQCRPCGTGQALLTKEQLEHLTSDLLANGRWHGFYAGYGKAYGVSPYAIKTVVKQVLQSRK